MNIISIDYEKGIVQSDFLQWKIVSNNNNKQMLLEREEKGKYHAAEADIQKKQMFEVKEIAYKGPSGEMFALDSDSGVVRIC